ncbi:MAG: DNA replication and repair protein RecF [Muribaculaceae bacterium]|nr:DNA replication and repair protein RecF [Muribaculaceae bacterium]MBR0023918.1 DNA replication and repair protein RecF [Muribaculaceae bacterium]
MTLEQLTILNYKNIVEAQLRFSPNVNCLIGNNGMGKTNVLDAIYYLSYCKSFTSSNEHSAAINHDANFLMLQGRYSRKGSPEEIALSVQRGKRKTVKRNGKDYKRLSEHIGLLPLVMISPLDWDLIRGGSDERRRLMDQIISQGNRQYLDALIRYNKALEQRNSMIKNDYRDPLLYETVEQVMATTATVLYDSRKQWLEVFSPIFMRYYQAIAGDAEKVRLSYKSHLSELSMQQVLNANRDRDMIMGYTTRGVHRDDIDLWLGDHPMRKTGSQGQCKTYTIALRMAQFEFLKQYTGTTPILLLDDIFDKLDEQRVVSIINVVSNNQDFGQIFITDTNRTHLDEIISMMSGDYAMFVVENGIVTPIASRQEETRQ